MMWRLWCWAFGHLENSETIVEHVFTSATNTTQAVEYTALSCDRCGRWL